MAKSRNARIRKNQDASNEGATVTRGRQLRTPKTRLEASETAQQRLATPKPRLALVQILPSSRQEMIAEAAYYKAEKRGFVPGSEVGDWLDAEKEIDRLLRLN